MQRLINSCVQGKMDQILAADVAQSYICCSACQKFKAVFVHNPSFVSTLLMGEYIDRRRLPGMLKWIDEHGAAVKTLVFRTGSPWSEAALTALLSCCVVHKLPACLTSAHLMDVTDGSISLLGCLTSLTQIRLDGRSASENLDLAPLQELPRLTTLSLANANCVSLSNLKHLTDFSAKVCRIWFQGNCAFVTALLKLSIDSTSLKQFHEVGISACSNLQHLECLGADIGAVNHEETMSFSRTRLCVPHSVSALTALTFLRISYSNNKCVELDWIGQLPSLQSVALHFCVEDMKLLASVGGLTRLTKMHLTNSLPKGQIHCSFAWPRLVALQVLTITGSVQFERGLSDMAQLLSLTHVTLEDMRQSDAKTVLQLGLLAHKLGATRTDVIFSLLS